METNIKATVKMASGMNAMECAVEEMTLLVAICDRNKEKIIVDLFQGRNARFNLSVLGQGTASSRILDYLGLGAVEKTLLISEMPAVAAEKTMKEIDERLNLKRPGGGIAFTLPLSGNTEESEMTQKEFEYELILTVANRGCTEEVMDAARGAKATGGTVLHAKDFSLEDAKFFGVHIRPEKEIILILTEKHKKEEIAKAIMEKAGPGTLSDAMLLSLPVSAVEGLHPELAQEAGI